MDGRTPPSRRRDTVATRIAGPALVGDDVVSEEHVVDFENAGQQQKKSTFSLCCCHNRTIEGMPGGACCVCSRFMCKDGGQRLCIICELAVCPQDSKQSDDGPYCRTHGLFQLMAYHMRRLTWNGKQIEGGRK